MLNRCWCASNRAANHLILFMVKIKYIDYSKVYMHTAEFLLATVFLRCLKQYRNNVEENELDYLHYKTYSVLPGSPNAVTEFAFCDGQLQLLNKAFWTLVQGKQEA